MSPPEIEALGVTATAVGQHLDVTRQRVMQLVDEGVLATLENGRFDLEDCRIRYIRWLRGADRRAAKGQAASRVTEARAREIEQRIAERDRRLVDIQEHEELFVEAFGSIRSGLSVVPVRVTKDLAMRRKIEAEIDEVLRKAADRFAEGTADLKAGGAGPAADAEDDA